MKNVSKNRIVDSFFMFSYEENITQGSTILLVLLLLKVPWASDQQWSANIRYNTLIFLLYICGTVEILGHVQHVLVGGVTPRDTVTCRP